MRPLTERQIGILRDVGQFRKIELGRLYARFGQFRHSSMLRTVVSLLNRNLIAFADGKPGRCVLTPAGKRLVRLANHPGIATPKKRRSSSHRRASK